jgi:hypothetical protein
MTIATIGGERPAGLAARLGAAPFWLWWLVALLAATGLAVLAKGTGRAFEFVDSDDALRFVQVRELLAGAAWYPVETSMIGGRGGLVSHWSRLLDAPMAIILGVVRLWLPEALAQKVLLVVWPLLMLGAALWVIGRSTMRAHGRATALIALALGALSLQAYYQFAPGRIDHHSAMIAATLASALIMWAAPQSPVAWRWAGASGAVALAIGYEALAPVVVLAGLAGAWGLFDRRMAPCAGGFVIGFAFGLALAFVATVPASSWLVIHCDALSLNMVVLALTCGIGFSLALQHASTWSWSRRVAVMACCGGAGLAMYGALEPRCLAGPMAQVDRALWPLWIDHVDEAKSLLGEVLRGNLAGSAAPVAVLVAGLAAAVAGLLRSERQGDGFLLMATAAFVALALWQMKFLAYAALILAPGVAVLIARLPAIGELKAPLVRVLALVLLNQFALFSLSTSVKGALAPATARLDAARSSPQADIAGALWTCTTADDLRALAQVPAGLVVTHNDIGAHLVAATPHRALSGPYHRIPEAMIANFGIFSARSADETGLLLVETGADYVLSCIVLDRQIMRLPSSPGTFAADLAEGRIPHFLTPVPLDAAPLYRMWRVERSRLPARRSPSRLRAG